MEAVIYGHLGADAKETEKGFSFAVADNYKEGNEDKTLWINCFHNFPSKIMPFMKKGTPVIVWGEVTVGVYKRGENDYTPSVTCFVSKIKLLSNKTQ